MIVQTWKTTVLNDDELRTAAMKLKNSIRDLGDYDVFTVYIYMYY